MISAVQLSLVFPFAWGNWNNPPELSYNDKLPPGTYMVIFSPGNGRQKKRFDNLVTQGELTLHYQAPQAVNRTSGHGQDPRNTLVIFTKS